MPTLSSYVSTVRDFVNDPNGQFWTVYQINDYVNRARNRVCLDSQCLRVLPPSTASIATATASVVGSGYTSPTVTINAPDGPVGGVQAVLTANVVGGQITSYTIVNAGTGYAGPPIITITDPTGSGAVCAVTLTTQLTTSPNQETYPLSSFTPAIQLANPGVLEAFAIQSISASWGQLKPTLDYRSWTDFQAKYRAYNIGAQNYPTVWSMYGSGQGGTVYCWPIPAGYAAWDIDCYCVPIPLLTDSTVDAVPYPHNDCVPYYAAYLAFSNAQRKDDAQYYMQLYRERMIASGMFVTPSWSPSAYEGY